ncbi:DUF4124 domain-containing protein [Candidatus Sororendozoicomonas aggregata]|uniref:DUF4124 domain-containing protein n=1 Tax=Candidatus Sororendozoicomonas aggregata TaxID=3073239 RepID=UPI002ED50666
MKKIIILLLLAPGLLTADKLYKWLDSEGVIQYSSSPPEPASVEATNKVDINGLVSFEKHSRPLPDLPQVTDNRKKRESSRCQALKADLYTLQYHHRVRIKLPSGEYSELSPEEKQEKLREITKLFEQQCAR